MIRFDLGRWTVSIWPSEIIGIAILLCGVWVFWRAQLDPRNPLNLATMFMWRGRPTDMSMALFLAFWAALIAMWVIIDQELKGKLGEGTYIAFLGILVAGKAATEGINAWRAWRSKRQDKGGCEPPH